MIRSLLSVFGLVSKKPSPSAARKPQTNTRVRLGQDINLDRRDVPAVVGPYVELGFVTPLNGDLGSLQAPTAPGLTVDVIDDLNPAFDWQISVNAAHGVAIVVKDKASSLCAVFGSARVVDGIDQIGVTLFHETTQRKALTGTVNVNDKVLLPFAPSALAGIPADAPVNQPPGPHGNGAGPFG